MKTLFRIAGALFLAAWCLHLYTATAALRGFFGDGSLVFLLALSKSAILGGDSVRTYLYGANVPREAQFVLNNIGLQLALWAHVADPQAMKYIFNFWQFALPGFLYLALFYMLHRAGKLVWGIFPLISWAVLSVPVDWNAVNSSRWAVPIFWMHLFLVLLAGRRVRFRPAAGAALIGLAMLGGLYETVVLQAGLCLAVAAILWVREKNRTPLIYAAAALPGALRAAYSYFAEGGKDIPGGTPFLVLASYAPQPFCLFIILTLAIATGLLALPLLRRPQFLPLLLAVFLAGLLYAINAGLPNVWPQITMRYDYLLLSFVLMAGACSQRVLQNPPSLRAAMPAAIFSLMAGTALWGFQIAGTAGWADCRAGYNAAKSGAPLATMPGLASLSLFRPNPNLQILSPAHFSQCFWDWAAPWTDLLMEPSGKISQWPQYTFWQNFSFIRKPDGVFLHTNNWTLVLPATMLSQHDLPLKTPLYDLTPLYHQIGLGDLFPRQRCLSPEKWNGFISSKYLLALDDEKRQAMSVCTRSQMPQGEGAP